MPSVARSPLMSWPLHAQKQHQGSDSDEEEGRASAFAAKGGIQASEAVGSTQAAVAGSAQGSDSKAVLSREQLLAAPLQGVKKKKKRKKVAVGPPTAGL